ncbi:MAG: LysR family transcriptional regulator [Leucobacter sp.]|nr:LysR family transcriptional regulator [Leucobacter sp.]
MPALRVGFARGVAPGKWARRWEEATGSRLELVPLPARGTHGFDLVLERVDPGALPQGANSPEASRRAVRLYEESVAIVVAADHELADERRAGLDALQLVTLLAHPHHAPAWPAPEPWADPSWMPRDAAAALKLVASGAGAILLPLPLARHLSSKREHAVLPLDAELPGTEIWASWAIERDAPDMQQLVGILRGRTARSGRGSAGTGQSANGQGQPERPNRAAQPAAKKKPLPKHSRGAQLAAAKARKRGKR